MKTKLIWHSIREELPKDGEWVLARFSIGSLSKKPQLFKWDAERDKSVPDQAPDLSWMSIPSLDVEEDEETKAETEELLNEHAESPKDYSDAPLPSNLSQPSKKKKESRVSRWERAANDAQSALSELQDIQQEFSEWNDNLPENLQDSALGEKLRAVVEDLDIETALSTAEDAVNADLPLGFGRD